MLRTLDEYQEMLSNLRNFQPRALLEELREESDPRFVERLWPRLLASRQRYALILFVRHLLEREDAPVMIPALNLLDEDDLLLNLLGLELLAGRELPGRDAVIADLLHHPRTEVRVVAVRLAGQLRLRDCFGQIFSLWLNPMVPHVLRKECRITLGHLLEDRPLLGRILRIPEAWA